MDGRVEQIVLQGSTRNRAGKNLLISLQLVVRDHALLRWRQAHPAVVLRDIDWLVGHPLGYVAGRANGYVYGSYEDGIMDLLDPDGRPAKLAAVGDMIQNSVLPWLAETAQRAAVAVHSHADERVLRRRLGYHSRIPISGALFPLPVPWLHRRTTGSQAVW
ncbi:hypothetical protein [Micromonospora sp. NPDC005173]|uniref:hypothetical protein n=1 Tax=Micromonospora sp. NPDC005173 TaxID=3157165 RepID=UPI0033B340AC